MQTSSKQGCPDCSVEPGQEHMRGCDVERCPMCGGQAISCGHRKRTLPRLKWTGQWPGQAECVEFGWHSRFVNGAWQRCEATDPGAQPDLNRLATEAQWSAALGRFVLPEGPR